MNDKPNTLVTGAAGQVGQQVPHATQQPLFNPVRMGKLELPNRIVMAPLTRIRAANSRHAPTELHAEYYAQRASAGLIIGECTEISPDAYGWADTPGLWSDAQLRGWRGVTDAVHKKGGLIYAQLWHTGAMSHPDFFDAPHRCPRSM
jgi:N-ethylmaleimide reductase